jgi:hypothetical protein
VEKTENIMEYVVVGPRCYGNGKTLAAAVKAAKKHYPSYQDPERMPYNAYEASPDWTVDDFGAISATTLTKIKEHRPS